MSFPINEFWKLAVESLVLSADECKKLAAQFGQMKGAAETGNARTLSDWLVAQRVLTRYQAKLLLARRPGPFIYGDYKLQDRIESGRLTGLFRAIHVPSRLPVCLYFLSGSGLQDPAAMARLKQPLAAIAAIQHPHVARVYHVVDLPSYKFVVLGDLQGHSLDEHLASASGRSTPAEACRLVRQAALGLAQLHQAGQMHGELRPGNLWLDQTGGLKVLPLPLARDPLAPPTVPHAPGVTPEQLQAAANCLAPELATPGRWPDTRSDVYALGCVLYEMLAGKPPFAGGDWRARLRRHASEQPTPVNQINAQVPGPVAQVVGYLMAKDPAARYQQMQHVGEALLPYIDQGAAKAVAEQPTPMSRAYDEWLKKLQASTVPTAVRVAPSAAPAMQPGSQTVFPQAATVFPQAGAVFPQTPGAPVPMAQPAYAPTGQFSPPGYGGVAAMAAPVMAAPMAVAAQPAVAMPGAPALPDFTTVDEVPRVSVPAARRRRRQSSDLKAWLILSVGAVVLVGMVAAAWNRFGGSATLTGKEPPTVDPNAVAANTEGAKKPTKEATSAKGTATAANVPPAPVGEQIASVDNDPVWESPTTGQPLDLSYFPSGVRVYVALRPADIWRNEEAHRVLSALGIEESLRERLTKHGGTPVENIEQAIFGFGGAGSQAETYLVVRAKASIADDDLRQNWGVQDSEEVAGKTVFRAGNVTLYAPPDEQNKLTIAVEMADGKMLESWLASPKNWPPLRDFEPLVKSSDASRLVTVLFAPRFFSGAGRSLFTGPAERLHDPLLSFFTDASGMPPPACAVSMHLSPDLFTELRILGDPERSPRDVAKDFRKKIQDLPEAIERHHVSLEISPYSRPVLARYPRWIEELDRYTRAGTIDKQVVLRNYLPPLAAHNLAFGTQLALLESGRGGAVTVAGAQPQGPKTLADKLKQKYTLTFDRDSLERTIALISTDTGIPMTILGGDLQLEGITKNQSFGLDEKDKPVFEILKTIMKKANPDGKLVYVIRNEGGKEELVITTRAGAAKRKEKLPPELE